MAESKNTGDSRPRVAADPATDEGVKPKIYGFLDLIGKAYGNRLRLNVLKRRPEWFDENDHEWHEWNDVHDCYLRAYFQTAFGMYNPKMLDDATSIYFNDHKVNPVVDLLDSLKWDGKNRIENFLHDIAGTEDTPYNRECSRLIFAGGVHRAYRPGCKFDDMVVFVGRQGCGKSTLVRWLNMDDAFYREIKTITGKEGQETLRGVWIGEVAELMAMTRAKEVETVKAYITSQEDSYRPPYGRHVETFPRMCAFIGTTNNEQFLSDQTGNRRFYPVKVTVDGYDVFDKEKEAREYIRQCWAEAVVRFKANDLQPYAKRELLEAIRAAQEDAMEDDWRVGMIQKYVDDTMHPGDVVCVIELWHNALGAPEESQPTRKDSIEICKILTNQLGLKRVGVRRLPKWGIQKCFGLANTEFFPFWGKR